MPVADLMIHLFVSHLPVQLKYHEFFDIFSTQQRNLTLIQEFFFHDGRWNQKSLKQPGVSKRITSP